MNYVLPEELGNKILTYLVKQPYEDVAPFVEQLKSLQQVTIVSPSFTGTTDEGSVIDNVQSTETKNSKEALSQEAIQSPNGQE